MFGSVTGVVLFHVAFGLPFAIFLLRNFFAAIPRDLLEAARMDGGSEWTIFRRVIFPLGGPAIASLGIFQFLWVWNDLLVALVFADTEAQPMTKWLQSQMRQFTGNIDILAPGAFLSLIVPLAVFFAFQRYVVQGVLAGSVKGPARPDGPGLGRPGLGRRPRRAAGRGRRRPAGDGSGALRSETWHRREALHRPGGRCRASRRRSGGR